MLSLNTIEILWAISTICFFLFVAYIINSLYKDLKELREIEKYLNDKNNW